MAHQLYQIDGEDSMAYTGETPWHGLGQKIGDNEPLEIWAKRAHLDWQLIEMPVQVVLPKMGYRDSDLALPIPNRKAIVRDDTLETLSVVSSRYNIVQPLEIVEFFRDLIRDNGFKMESAGSVMDGRRVWALARTGLDFSLGSDDPVSSYLLMATSCDGSMSTTAAMTSVRVVCNNTLEVAYEHSEKKGSRAIRVPHAATFCEDKIKLDLFGMESSWAKFKGMATDMSYFKMSEADAVKFFIRLLHNPKNKDDYSDVPARVLEKIHTAFQTAPGANTPSAQNTLWGAVNAVTYFADHIRGRDASRAQAAMFGPGRILKLNAWKIAEEILSGTTSPDDSIQIAA